MDFRGEQYLLEKDRTLHQRREVELEQLHKGLVSTKPVDRVADWLKVLEKTHLGHRERDPRVLEGIKNYYHKQYILPYQEEITRGVAKVEVKAAREMGYGEQHYEGEAFVQRQEIAVEDLEKSLDQWIDYLTDPNEPYPMWFRYYVFTNVVRMGSYDFDKKEFRKRGKDTFFPFPDIDRGALGHVQSLIRCAKDNIFLESFRAGQVKGAADNMPEELLMTKEKAIAFANKSFADQYAEAIKSNGEITPEMRAETRGEWKHFDQWSDPDELWGSLQNKGVPWCTRGYATAGVQLQSGDFYVYYTLDKQGNPTIPRIAIRMDGNKIGEVRGVADNNQNLEGNMTEIAERKIDQLPGADKYRKASVDMKRLTEIEHITKRGGDLNVDDLKFIYEIDQNIVGFGYREDPRIEEILSQRFRMIQHDFARIYEVEPENVAITNEGINQDTIICLDKSRINLHELVDKTGGKIKILYGEIINDLDHELGTGLNDLKKLYRLERMGSRRRFIQYLVQRVMHYHENNLLGRNTLLKMGLAIERPAREVESAIMERIDQAIDFVADSPNHDDLPLLTSSFFADREPGDGTYDESGSDYCYMHMDRISFDRLVLLVEKTMDPRAVSDMFEFFMYSEEISEEDGIKIINSLMRLPEKALELLAGRFPNNVPGGNKRAHDPYLSANIFEKMVWCPELLVFVLKNSHIPQIKIFIAKNIERIKEIAKMNSIELPPDFA